MEQRRYFERGLPASDYGDIPAFEFA